MTIRLPRILVVFSILFSTVACDQSTKAVMRDSLSVTGPLHYLWNHIHLLSAENPGAFLNLGADLPESWRFWIFTISCTVFLAGLTAYILNSEPNPSALIGLTLILAGGFGNLIDRYTQGHVTDFILLTTGNLHTGIFNLADVAITGGAAILAFAQWPRPGPKNLITLCSTHHRLWHKGQKG